MAGTLLTHLTALARARHPHTSPEALRETGDYLAHQFTDAGLTVARHPFEAWGETYENVVATVPASTGTIAPPLIVAAHYDTVDDSPGADDNASGLVVLLDIACRLAKTPLARPVHCIAFCLEEEHLLGSRAYTAHLTATGQSIHGAIVLECVGYASTREGSQRTPPGLPITVPTIGNFLAIIGNQASASLTSGVAQAMAPSVPVIPLIVPGNGELLPDTRRSDHTAFWEQGFPAVMVTDTANFRNPHYHRPTDTIDTLNLDFLTAVTTAIHNAVTALATTPKEAS